MNYIKIIVISVCVFLLGKCNLNGQCDFCKKRGSVMKCENIINLYGDTISNYFYSNYTESVVINKTIYYPFIFGESNTDTIGYIRFYDDKIILLPKVYKDNYDYNESKLFDFSPDNRSKWNVKYAGIINNYSINLENIITDEIEDSLYVFNFEILPPYPSSITKINKIYVSKKSGIRSIDLDFDGIPIKCSCKE